MLVRSTMLVLDTVPVLVHGTVLVLVHGTVLVLVHDMVLVLVPVPVLLPVESTMYPVSNHQPPLHHMLFPYHVTA